MKGLIYVLAFLVGFAAGPGSLAPLSSTAIGSPTDSAVQPSRSVDSPLAQGESKAGGTDLPPRQSEGDEVEPSQPQHGQEAAIVVDAPTKGRVGELIRFDLTKSIAASIKWRLLPDSADFQVYEDGRRAVFSARTAGEYMFIIAAANGDTVDVVTHTVKIEGPPPKPESSSLAEWVPYWLYSMQLDPKTAIELAESFESVSDRITAISTPKGIIEATAEANRAALGDELETWKPLLKKIQAALANQARAGTLATPDQHKETWLEIAKGLRKYAS